MAANKEYREDRTCESCGEQGAALVSEKADDEPLWLCKRCMDMHFRKRMTDDDIVTLVEKHWGINVNHKIDVCSRCHSRRIIIKSIDGKRFFTKCNCGIGEGFQDTMFFGL